jgi:hypothetical protein
MSTGGGFDESVFEKPLEAESKARNEKPKFRSWVRAKIENGLRCIFMREK